MANECEQEIEAAEALVFSVRLEDDARRVGLPMRKRFDRVQREGVSPPDVQIAFLKELVCNPQEADKFYANPVDYAHNKGVSLDPEVIRIAINATLFDEFITRDVAEKLGSKGLRDLMDLREIAPSAGAIVTAAKAVKLAVCSTVVVTDLRRALRVQ